MKNFFFSLFIIVSASSAFAMDIEPEILTLEKKYSEYYRCQTGVLTHIDRQFPGAVLGLPTGINVTSFEGVTPGRISYKVSVLNQIIVESGDGDQKLILKDFSVVVSRAHCGLVELSYTTRLAE